MALGRFSLVIGCGYSSSEILHLPCTKFSHNSSMGQIFELRSHPWAKNLKPIFTIKLEVGQRVLLANMFSVAQSSQKFLCQTCSFGTEADLRHNRAVNKFSVRNWNRSITLKKAKATSWIKVTAVYEKHIYFVFCCQ